MAFMIGIGGIVTELVGGRRGFSPPNLPGFTSVQMGHLFRVVVVALAPAEGGIKK
jgi:hypothetical protein